MKYISIFQYWDELYAILCFPLAALHFQRKIVVKNEDKYIFYILIALFVFISIGLVSNKIYRYQKSAAIIQDLFINLKFFMGIATTYFLFKNFKINIYKNRIRFHCKLLITLYLILVLQNKITHFFSVADMRFGLNAEKIFFNHPTELASATFFLLLVLIISSTNISNSIFPIGMASIVILLTLRFKAIATVMLFLYMYFIVISGKKIKLIYFFPIIPFIISVGWKEFYFYFFSDVSMITARGALSNISLKVARDLFPFGSGFGTFASWMSGIYYSPVYLLYGIDTVWGLSENWAGLVSDVFWPMVIAQNGFIGFILYIFIIICLFKIIFQCSKIDKRLYLAGMGALIYLLVSSIAESAFVNPLALPLAFVIGLCICTYKQKERGIN